MTIASGGYPRRRAKQDKKMTDKNYIPNPQDRRQELKEMLAKADAITESAMTAKQKENAAASFTMMAAAVKIAIGALHEQFPDGLIFSTSTTTNSDGIIAERTTIAATATAMAIEWHRAGMDDLQHSKSRAMIADLVLETKMAKARQDAAAERAAAAADDDK